MAKYVIEGNTLTNIANAIREKTGMSNSLYPESMPGYIRNIQTGDLDTTGIPNDVVAEAERLAATVANKISSNSITFVALTDMHELGDNDTKDASVLERQRRANKNAGQAARLISDKVSLDFCAFLGDYAYAANNASLVTSNYDLIRSMVTAKGYLTRIGEKTNLIEVPGNHDPLFDYTDASGAYFTNDLVTGIIGNYRYLDLDSRKVRIIALNTAEFVSGHSRSVARMSGEQLKWFANALDLSAKTNAADWKTIILSHHPLDWSGLENANKLLQAYTEGKSFSATHNGVSVSYNYTGKNVASVIAQFHGHTHCLKVGNIGSTDVKRIAIPNACYNRNNEYGQDGNYTFGEVTRCNKYDDHTGRNTAFCLITIDLDKQVIYADCFGSLGATEPGINAGYDRVISYSNTEVITYTVTNNLTNAVNGNTSATVIGGTAYTGTITPNTNYAIETVKVTMGGVDITASVYSNGIVSIPNVSGNIVITVTAVYNEPIVITNLVTTSLSPLGTGVYNAPYGYKDDTYVTGINDGGTDNACVATGLILLDSNTEAIYIKGAKWDTTNSHVRFYVVSSIGATYASHTVKADGSGSTTLSNFFTVEELDTNYYKWTLNANAKSALYGRYYCVSLVADSGENLIITHNQPIE